MRPFIVLGDRTDHGGVVIGSTQTTDTFGQRLARVGDQVTCPKKGHGTTVIVTGDPTMIVDGAPVARHGDKCACGATLISSQVVSGVGDLSSSGGVAQRTSAGPGKDTRHDVSTHATPAKTPSHDLHFLVRDATTGSPLPNIPYRITLEDGHAITGVTNDAGLTDKVQAHNAKIATIEAPYHGHSTGNTDTDHGHDTCGC